jgi:hypothetical protein
MHASATFCMFGRAPLDRIVETTDLIELVRIVFENLSGFISKMRASPNVGGCRIKETRPVPPIRFSTRFSSLREKKFFFNRLLLLPPRGGSASTLWGFRQHIQKTKYEPQRTISRSDDPTPTQTRSSIRGPFIRIPDPCL